jgi:oligopeptide/dipeptide ABC transporter ATP-binding protein
MSNPILQVRDLCVEIATSRGKVYPVEDVSFEVRAGEAMGLVGESGSGKSMTLRAILGILPRHARVVKGNAYFQGTDLLQLDRASLSRIQGRSLSMVFQEPMTALNPLMRIGEQIAEPLRVHLRYNKERAHARALELMRKVGIPDAERRMRAFPHELSGGMRQRIMIAMALSCEPELILCDEPTTALDVTIQDQILKLLVGLCADMGLSLVFVTHDLPVVAQACERIAVMYAARVVETGRVDEVLGSPRHPYTYSLLRSIPDFEHVQETLEPIPGTPPDVATPPPGCRFHPRCPMAKPDCDKGIFPLLTIGPDRMSACRYHDECAILGKGAYQLHE